MKNSIKDYLFALMIVIVSLLFAALDFWFIVPFLWNHGSSFAADAAFFLVIIGFAAIYLSYFAARLMFNAATEKED